MRKTDACHHVWIVNQYGRTPDQPGSTRHYEFGQLLAGSFKKVTVFASDVSSDLLGSSKASARELYHEQMYGNVRFVWIHAPSYVGNGFRRVWNMIAFAVNFIRTAIVYGKQERPTCIMASSPSPLASFAASLVAIAWRKRFILELLDLWPQCLIDMGLREWSLYGKALRFIEWWLYKSSHSIVVHAKGSIDYLRKRGIEGSRVVYVPNGVILENFAHWPRQSAERLEWRHEFGFDRFSVVYTGAHGPANALDTLLKGARLLQDWGAAIDVVLVGGGMLKPSLIELADSLELRNTRFVDSMPKNRILKLLAAADCGVITLRDVDAFAYGVSPNKLLDYMASSLPVVCSIPGTLAKMVDEAHAGVRCQPEDPEALALAIARVAEMSPPDRDLMGRQGYSLIEQEFSTVNLANRLAEVVFVQPTA
jgi:glycosyltransferase involved in cell wall biosynthesis